VNLLVCGEAVSNIFDGSKVLDESVPSFSSPPPSPSGSYGASGKSSNDAVALRGITAQHDVGFLTLLESLRYTKVGENLKTPCLPVWVVGSSSHYTVVFSLDKRIVQVPESEKRKRQMKAAFVELDPNENGFIPVASLGQYLMKLGFNGNIQTIQRQVDMDNMGICLWENVLPVVSDLLDKQQQQQQQPPWVCTICTYENNPARSVCDMCSARSPPLPPPPPPKRIEEEAKVVSPFSLYHFNGLEGSGKAIAECRRIIVTLLNGAPMPTDNVRAGLREVLLTKWPSAIIEYHQNLVPKIES